GTYGAVARLDRRARGTAVTRRPGPGAREGAVPCQAADGGRRAGGGRAVVGLNLGESLHPAAPGPRGVRHACRTAASGCGRPAELAGVDQQAAGRWVAGNGRGEGLRQHLVAKVRHAAREAVTVMMTVVPLAHLLLQRLLHLLHLLQLRYV